MGSMPPIVAHIIVWNAVGSRLFLRRAVHCPLPAARGAVVERRRGGLCGGGAGAGFLSLAYTPCLLSLPTDSMTAWALIRISSGASSRRLPASCRRVFSSSIALVSASAVLQFVWRKCAKPAPPSWKALSPSRSAARPGKWPSVRLWVSASAPVPAPAALLSSSSSSSLSSSSCSVSSSLLGGGWRAGVLPARRLRSRLARRNSL